MPPVVQVSNSMTQYADNSEKCCARGDATRVGSGITDQLPVRWNGQFKINKQID
jgi:hypothetical protein